jgi:hypothetical protein
MKKLALSVVALMVATGGATLGAVGCSSSSSSGSPATGDSGTEPDVTAGDSGTPEDSSTNTDTGTPEGDSSTPMEAAACTTDASIAVGVDTDAGFAVNQPCSDCINTSCGQPACSCITDTNIVALDDAGDNTTACGEYVGCVYQGLVGFVQANPDAGAMALTTALGQAQMQCNTALSTPMASKGDGDQLIGCVASMCASSCLQ